MRIVLYVCCIAMHCTVLCCLVLDSYVYVLLHVCVLCVLYCVAFACASAIAIAIATTTAIARAFELHCIAVRRIVL